MRAGMAASGSGEPLSGSSTPASQKRAPLRSMGSEVLRSIWSLVGDGDGYIDAMAPWALKKTDPARMATVLYVLAETLRTLAIVIQPFMPEKMAALLDQLAVPADKRDFGALGEGGRLVPGTALPPPQGLFPRIVDAE